MCFSDSRLEKPPHWLLVIPNLSHCWSEPWLLLQWFLPLSTSRWLCNTAIDTRTRRWAVEGLAYLTLDADVKDDFVQDIPALQAMFELAKARVVQISKLRKGCQFVGPGAQGLAGCGLTLAPPSLVELDWLFHWIALISSGCGTHSSVLSKMIGQHVCLGPLGSEILREHRQCLDSSGSGRWSSRISLETSSDLPLW